MSPLVLTAAVLLLAPAVMPGDYYIDVGSLALTYIVLGTAFNLLYGYLGLLSFAQVAFFGIGGYVAAWLATNTDVWQPVGLLAGGVAAGAAAIMLGIVTVRLSDGAFVIITLSFTLLCGLIAAAWTGVTGGRQGLFGLPSLSVSVGQSQFVVDMPRDYYYLLAAFTIGSLLIMLRLVTSSTGKVLVAIRDNEPLAKSQGYPTNAYKLYIFTVCAVITGIAGALHTFRLTTIDPSVFDFYLMQAMLIVVILGGAGTFWPVVWCSVIFAVVPELLRVADEARLIVYGALLVIALLFVPQGVGGWLRSRSVNRHLRQLKGRSPS